MIISSFIPDVPSFASDEILLLLFAKCSEHTHVQCPIYHPSGIIHHAPISKFIFNCDFKHCNALVWRDKNSFFTAFFQSGYFGSLWLGAARFSSWFTCCWLQVFLCLFVLLPDGDDSQKKWTKKKMVLIVPNCTGLRADGADGKPFGLGTSLLSSSLLLSSSSSQSSSSSSLSSSSSSPSSSRHGCHHYHHQHFIRCWASFHWRPGHRPRRRSGQNYSIAKMRSLKPQILWPLHLQKCGKINVFLQHFVAETTTYVVVIWNQCKWPLKQIGLVAHWKHCQGHNGPRLLRPQIYLGPIEKDNLPFTSQISRRALLYWDMSFSKKKQRLFHWSRSSSYTVYQWHW